MLAPPSQEGSEVGGKGTGQHLLINDMQKDTNHGVAAIEGGRSFQADGINVLRPSLISNTNYGPLLFFPHLKP
jgi:hypothetical protein